MGNTFQRGGGKHENQNPGITFRPLAFVNITHFNQKQCKKF